MENTWHEKFVELSSNPFFITNSVGIEPRTTWVQVWQVTSRQSALSQYYGQYI
jgi:hypothetical protein